MAKLGKLSVLAGEGRRENCLAVSFPLGKLAQAARPAAKISANTAR